MIGIELLTHGKRKWTMDGIVSKSSWKQFKRHIHRAVSVFLLCFRSCLIVGSFVSIFKQKLLNWFELNLLERWDMGPGEDRNIYCEFELFSSEVWCMWFGLSGDLGHVCHRMHMLQRWSMLWTRAFTNKHLYLTLCQRRLSGFPPVKTDDTVSEKQPQYIRDETLKESFNILTKLIEWNQSSPLTLSRKRTSTLLKTPSPLTPPPGTHPCRRRSWRGPQRWRCWWWWRRSSSAPCVRGGPATSSPRSCSLSVCTAPAGHWWWRRGSRCWGSRCWTGSPSCTLRWEGTNGEHAGQNQGFGFKYSSKVLLVFCTAALC